MSNVYTTSFKITFSNGVFSCRVLGNGTKKILAFHGFGQDGEAFMPLVSALGDVSIYSIELPFHGNTNISNSKIPIEKSQIIEVIKKLISKENINRFSLLGFSIGTKLIFPIIEQLTNSIEQVILIAPDGIKENIWYKIATSSMISRKVFYKIISGDQIIEKLVKVGKKLNLIDSSQAAFVEKSISSKENKKRVYETWCYLRKLKLLRNKIAQTMNEKDMELIFVVGQKDQIINKKSISSFLGRLPKSKLIELPSGHHNLINQFALSLEKGNVIIGN